MSHHLSALQDIFMMLKIQREIIILHGASYVDELSYHEMFTDLENEI